MNEHGIFYYPYASFRDDQISLLKAAALYFDKLYILDPIKASWDMIGLLDWRDGKKSIQENGLHYLLMVSKS